MSGINYDLSKIKGFVFDVDGVLSPSTIPLGEDGYPRRMVNIKDGYALQLAVKKGYRIAIITGGKGIAIQTRFESLGIKDIYTGASKKTPDIERMVEQGESIPRRGSIYGRRHTRPTVLAPRRTPMRTIRRMLGSQRDCRLHFKILRRLRLWQRHY